jgi:hypothetical protein
MSLVMNFETKIGSFQNYSLKNSLMQIELAVERIWSPRFILIENYTGHDIQHSERLINYIIKLIKLYRGDVPFSEEEIYLLVASACLHDIGMQCDIWKEGHAEIRKIAESFGAEIDVRSNSDSSGGLSNFEQDAIRNNHNYLSAAWIKYSYIKRYRGLPPQNDLDIACMGIPENLVRDVIDICLYHSKMDINKCGSSPLMTDERKKFIASISRFADELDINYDRISMDNYDVFRIPQENLLSWWLHERTTIDLDVKTGNIAFYVSLHPEDEIKYGKIIERIYIDKFQEKNNSIIEILRRNNISIAIDNKSRARSSEFAPPIKSLTEGNSKKLIRILESEIEKDLFRSELSNSIKYGSKISEERLKPHLDKPEVFYGLNEEEWTWVLFSAMHGTSIEDVEIALIINGKAEICLIKILSDPTYPRFVRCKAVRVMRLIDKPIFLKPLILASGDSDKHVRHEALEALGEGEDINAEEPILAKFNQIDLKTLVDLAELENEEIPAEYIWSKEETYSEERIFWEGMEKVSQSGNQELEHYFISERELQDQIEQEILDKEQTAFIDQISNDDSDESVEPVNDEADIEAFSLGKKNNLDKIVFLKRMEEETERENQELEHYFISERELQDQIEQEILDKEQTAFIDQISNDDSDESVEPVNDEADIEAFSLGKKNNLDKIVFLKKMEEEAKRENQELEHDLISEQELQDQIEQEILDKEQTAFIDQMGNDDSDESVEPVNHEADIEAFSLGEKNNLDRIAFLKRMTEEAKREN